METVEDRVKKVKEIIAEHFGKEITELKDEISFINDLNADSLDAVEIVMELEDQFDMHIPDEQAEELTTVGKIVKYIEAKSDKDS